MHGRDIVVGDCDRGQRKPKWKKCEPKTEAMKGTDVGYL
jgi:hypothetical protein